MSTLYIREFEGMPLNINGSPQIWSEPGTDQTPVTYTGTAGQSAAFGARTKFIAITSDGIFSYRVGSSPTAVTTDFRVPASTIVCFAVTAGHKISAITNT